MSRIQVIHEDQSGSELRDIYEKIEENGAKILNLCRVLAHTPNVLRNFLQLGSSLIAKAGLSPKLRELVVLRVAKLTGSKYEWAQHYPTALEVGVSHEQTEVISHWSDSTKCNDKERAVLQYTDEVAQNIEVRDETFRRLRQHLNDQSIVELTLSIGYWGMAARLLVPLQVDIAIHSISSVQEFIGRKSHPR